MIKTLLWQNIPPNVNKMFPLKTQKTLEEKKGFTELPNYYP